MPGLKQQVMESAALGSSQLPPSVGQVTARRPSGPCPSALETRKSLNLLLETIESQVIPRLLLVNGSGDGPPAAAAAVPRAEAPVALTGEDVETLARALLTARPVDAFLRGLLGRGLTVDQLYSELMGPAARRMGELWDRDEASFADVTLGLGRLQQMLREFSFDFLGGSRPLRHPRSILLAPTPGEQHTFGVLMVAEYFRRAGWEVVCMPLADVDELSDALRSEWFAVAGISAGSEARLDNLAATIRVLRRASLNRSLAVMTGGAVFSDGPELVSRVGADAAAEDARQAPAVAERLLGLLASRCTG